MTRICKGCGEPIPASRARQAKFCVDTCGNRFRNRSWYSTKSVEYKKEHTAARNKKFRAKPEGRYSDHKSRAKQSGIPFYLSFEQWWDIWKPHWADRGTGGKVMCRDRDTGPYAIGNVRIDTQRNNNREARGLPLL